MLSETKLFFVEPGDPNTVIAYKPKEGKTMKDASLPSDFERDTDSDFTYRDEDLIEQEAKPKFHVGDVVDRHFDTGRFITGIIEEVKPSDWEHSPTISVVCHPAIRMFMVSGGKESGVVKINSVIHTIHRLIENGKVIDKYCQVRINQDRPGYINLGGPVCGVSARIRHFGYFVRLKTGIEYREPENPLCFCLEHSQEFIETQARLFKSENLN